MKLITTVENKDGAIKIIDSWDNHKNRHLKSIINMWGDLESIRFEVKDKFNKILAYKKFGGYVRITK